MRTLGSIGGSLKPKSGVRMRIPKMRKTMTLGKLGRKGGS
jgi:hypothetical protein